MGAPRVAPAASSREPMSAILDLLFAFPTVVFSIPVALSVLYWMAAIAGAVDIEVLDGADGGMDGALDGHLDAAVDGHLDAALDGHLDAALDGHLDAAVDGHLDAAVDGHLDAAADGVGDAVEGAAHASHGVSVLVTLLSALRLRGVPLTISLTAIFFFGWVLSMAATHYVAPSLPLPPAVVGLMVLIASFGGGYLLALQAVRPLEGVFITHTARRTHDLIGHTCVVSTGRVDGRFGQATVEDGGAGLILQVRCDREGALRRGNHALIVSFDGARDAFIIEPLAPERVAAEPARARPPAVTQQP